MTELITELGELLIECDLQLIGVGFFGRLSPVQCLF